MRVKTTVKAGALAPNHNEALVRAGGLKVRTSVKAGEWPIGTNHSEVVVRAGGLKVQTSIKAGSNLSDVSKQLQIQSIIGSW
jgi:hypothetical protein